MGFPEVRLRRMRRTAGLRALVRETELSVSDLIAPVFVVPGLGVKQPISSLPGQYHFSVDSCIEHCKQLRDCGIHSVLLFGIPDQKDEVGSSAWASNGVVQRTVAGLKRDIPDLTVVTDLCFCEYTSHGHCGIIKDGEVDNDATLEIIVKQSVSHAAAGADLIAPSGMMDGMVHAIRTGLDSSNLADVGIMSYSAKYASGFYGPFREAAQSAPEFGNRSSYQMDPGNVREALREVALDIEEGADVVMVKPALPYLDVLRAVRDRFDLPTAAYNVSGEYAMIKAAGERGWIDESRVAYEALLSIKRAGADIIITYFAEDFAKGVISSQS